MRLNACLECGEGFQSARTHAEFCRPSCRAAFNNRRLQRGAEIYDLYMALRFERGLAKDLGVFQAINRLASDYRAEDQDRRKGRKSWRGPEAVLATRPTLKSIRSTTRVGR